MYKHEKNKFIDGIEYRFCGELKEYRPLTEFNTTVRNGKIYYRGICREGKKINNQRYKEITRKAIKIWKLKNKERISVTGSHRRALKRKACPSWLSNDQMKIMREIYRKRFELSKNLNKKNEYQVHHYYPLTGETDRKGNQISCGLHVPWNLIIIPHNINASIGARNPEFHNYDLSKYKNLQTKYTKQIFQ